MLYLICAILMAMSTMVASTVNAQPTGTYTMRALGESAAMIAQANAFDAAKVEANGDTTLSVLTATRAWKNFQRTKGTPAARNIAARNLVNAMLNSAFVLPSSASTPSVAPSSQIMALADSMKALSGRVNTLAARVDSTEFKLAVVRFATLDAMRSLAIYGDNSRRSSKTRRKQLAKEAQAIAERLKQERESW